MADVTVVGQTMVLRGSISGEGDIEIHGRVEGDIEVDGDVTLAEGAMVRGDIAGRRIVVRGAVAGNLTGENGVRLETGARVVGDVTAATIGILDGALLRGNIETGQAVKKAAPKRSSAAQAQPLPKTAPAAQAPARGKAPPAQERPAPPPPVVPALRKGARAALKRKAR
jgi:cytoskeletal protein CcmA (bactofilin family)